MLMKRDLDVSGMLALVPNLQQRIEFSSLHSFIRVLFRLSSQSHNLRYSTYGCLFIRTRCQVSISCQNYHKSIT